MDIKLWFMGYSWLELVKWLSSWEGHGWNHLVDRRWWKVVQWELCARLPLLGKHARILLLYMSIIFPQRFPLMRRLQAQMLHSFIKQSTPECLLWGWQELGHACKCLAIHISLRRELKVCCNLCGGGRWKKWETQGRQGWLELVNEEWEKVKDGQKEC